MFGHQAEQISLIKSNKRFAQTCAWGMEATFVLALIASIVAFAFAFFIPTFSCLMPLFVASIPLLIVIIEIIVALIPLDENIDKYKFKLSYLIDMQNSETYNTDAPSKRAFLKTGIHHAIAYIILPIFAISVIVLGFIIPPSLPVIFSTTLFQVHIPVATLLLNTLILISCKLYLQKNADTQIDDRYKLNFRWDDYTDNRYQYEELSFNEIESLEKQNFDNIYEIAPIAPNKAQIYSVKEPVQIKNHVDLTAILSKNH